MQRETIARYLEEGYKGRKNAISSCALEKALGLSGNELRKKINRLRCDSIPISACRGISMRRLLRRSTILSAVLKRCGMG